MAPPQLRGMLRKIIMRDLAIGVFLAFSGGAVWWFGVAKPRRLKYEEFYKDYDANAVAESMTASFEEEEGGF